VRFLEEQFLKVSREACCKHDVLPWVWEKHKKDGGIAPTIQEESPVGGLFSDPQAILPSDESEPGQVPYHAPPSVARLCIRLRVSGPGRIVM
jgi:hypothetical protein